ncbi:HK97 gp10 family phage protein, partial [Escherichia coli]|nr:HK97 gp10 family phage protein [Escherichia coli]
MIETLLDFSGLEDISRDLQLLSGAENNRVLREATRAGANVLKEEVVSRAPVRRGKLRRNVVVLSRCSRDGGMESGVHIRGVNPDTGNSDNTMKADNPRNAFYWRFVEMGTVNMPPHPFVRPAFDVRSEQAAQVYPYVVPLLDGRPSVALPWVVFSLISSVSADVMGGQAESSVSVQIDVYAGTVTQARQIRQDAREA